MTNILIVDDHAIVRQGLKSILEGKCVHTSFGEAQNTGEMMKYLRKQKWDIVILDINLPDRSGLEALKDLRHEYPELPVLMLSVHSEDQYAIRVLKSGASGFLAKSSAPDELVKAVTKVLSGGRYVSPAVAETIAKHLQTDRDRPLHEVLSNREFEVLRLIASGKTASEIADTLALSVKTISTFRTRILTKMKMRNNAELTHYVLENHLLD